jgi:hypothetical protein
MSDLPFHRRDLLKTGITLMGTTGLVQSAEAQDTSGPNGEPTEIRNWHDLDAVRQNLDGDYIVVNDLDQTTAGYDEHVGNPKKGWNPIGEVDRNAVEFTSFTGTIDGNGHTITGLEINRPKETDIGLFAMIANRPTTVTDLTLTELDVTGREFVGGIVGANVSGTVTRSEVTGEVTGETFVGGVVGNNSGDVRKSSFRGTVSGAESVGGLVGWNVEGASVRESWSRGEVTGDGIVGGLVGTMTDDGGTVRESWSSATVTGGYDAGGLVGYNKDSEGDPAGEVIDSYWNTDVAGQADAIGNNEGTVTGVTGLSTDEMTGDMARETMGALDFEATWQVVTAPDGYPMLQWQQPTANVEDPPDTEGFDPAMHGFGFPNWAGTFGETVDGEQFEYDDDGLTREAIQAAMVEDWAIDGDSLLWSILSRVFYGYLSSEAATNGHCYGMAFAAEEYFSTPSRLPDATDTASAVQKPTGEYASVGELIREYQTSQIISTAGPFVTNRALIDDSIDTTVAIEKLKTALDRAGTAGISLYSSTIDSIHDVLAYGYKEREDSVEVAVYDPNNPAVSGAEITSPYAASEAAGPSTSFEIDAVSGEMESGYENDLSDIVSPITYDRWAFTRPGLSLDVTEEMTGDADQYLSPFRQGLFIGLNSPATLEIDAPAESRVVHPRVPGDASTDEGYHDFAFVMNSRPGAYSVTVTGTGSGEYTLDLYGIQGNEPVIDESVSGPTAADQVDRVDIELGASESETNIEILRNVDTASKADSAVFGFTAEEIAAGGVASVAMVYAAARMLSDDEDDGPDNL